MLCINTGKQIATQNLINDVGIRKKKEEEEGIEIQEKHSNRNIMKHDFFFLNKIQILFDYDDEIIYFNENFLCMTHQKSIIFITSQFVNSS